MSLLWLSEPCRACTRCIACDNPWCRENEVSPGETEGICANCYETEDDDA